MESFWIKTKSTAHKYYKLIFSYLNRKKYCFYLLAIFDLLFAVANIFKQITVLGVLFLLINICFMFFSNKKRLNYIIFMLYPLSSVLKFGFMPTSFFTILIPFYIVFMIFQSFTPTLKIKKYEVKVMILFAIYIIYTLFISVLNFKGFTVSSLFSYYIYLALPIAAFCFIKNKDEVDGIWDIVICSATYLFGILVTLFFFNLIPNGQAKLASLGVAIDDMGSVGVRFSPLTDDPNYGTSLMLLIANLFFIGKKTKIQKKIGLPIILISLVISALSISKMFILGLIVTLLCLIIDFCKKKSNIYINFLIILIITTSIFVFLGTKLGNSLIIRTIGSTDGISLNRITSGRLNLFGQYTSYLLSNPLTLVFGKGPLFSDFSIFSQGEHNTFTQNLFGNGIIGVTIMLIIVLIMFNRRLDGLKRISLTPYSFSFLFSLILISMSLCLSPSTLFPMLLLSCQFIFVENKSNSTRIKLNSNYVEYEMLYI